MGFIDRDKIFQYQFYHVISLIILLLLLFLILQYPKSIYGNLWGFSTSIWIIIAILVPIIHQIFIVFVWRLELYNHYFSNKFKGKAFEIYLPIFMLLLVSRLISIILLAFSNEQTLDEFQLLFYIISIIIIAPVGYLLYSVVRYFGIKRAAGLDHFEEYISKTGFEKRGIYKYINNSMYIIGLMVLYLPGLLLASYSALVVALFQHAYIWIHYYTLEKPDLEKIYK